MKRRLFAFILAMLLLAPAAVSCSETTVDETENNAAEPGGEATSENSEETIGETEERIKPDIPETADFGGDEIRYIFWNISSWASGSHESRDLVVEEINGEAINDAVYNRNLLIGQNYNVIFELEVLAHDKIVSTVNTCIRSGDDTYDVVYPRLYEAVPLFSDGSLINIHEVPNIDISKPWWDSNIADSLTIFDYLPAIATSINVNDKDATAAVSFNKTVALNYGIEDPYTLVREGKWTIDKVWELADIVDNDTNGNGKMDDGDMYGFLGARDTMEAFYYGSGFQHASKTEDGGIAFTYGSEAEIDYTQKVMDFMATDMFYNGHVDAFPTGSDVRFSNNEALFLWIKLGSITNMRELEGEFGILPTPKANEEQEKHYSMVSRHHTGLLSIPTTAYGQKLEQLGIILEALAAESHYTVIPAYIETSLKTKHARDAESADMLDIIINSRIYDPVYIYDFGDFADQFLCMGEPGLDNITSFLKSRQKMIGKVIEKFNKSLLEILENQAQ